MSEFTKGPWRVAEDCRVDHLHVKNEETGREWYHSSRAIFAGDIKIATIDINISNTVSGHATPQSHGELLANAHLIAATPDLLEALEPFAALLQSHNDANEHGDPVQDGQPIFAINGAAITIGDLRKARAAIAKARGV